jgi:hypothetical protein
MSPEARERSFDELARGLASGSISRGKALKLMGAALVGGTLGSLGMGGIAAADDCKRRGKACKKDRQCCSGNCSGGTCACPVGTTLCGGNCVSTTCSEGFAFDPATCQCAPKLLYCVCSSGDAFYQCSTNEFTGEVDPCSPANRYYACFGGCVPSGGFPDVDRSTCIDSPCSSF